MHPPIRPHRRPPRIHRRHHTHHLAPTVNDDTLTAELAELRRFRDLVVDYWLDELHDPDRLPAPTDTFGWACRDQAITQGLLAPTAADVDPPETPA
jgi:hypothetical protein